MAEVQGRLETRSEADVRRLRTGETKQLTCFEFFYQEEHGTQAALPGLANEKQVDHAGIVIEVSRSARVTCNRVD